MIPRDSKICTCNNKQAAFLSDSNFWETFLLSSRLVKCICALVSRSLSSLIEIKSHNQEEPPLNFSLIIILQCICWVLLSVPIMFTNLLVVFTWYESFYIIQLHLFRTLVEKIEFKEFWLIYVKQSKYFNWFQIGKQCGWFWTCNVCVKKKQSYSK